jgi:hypothetical protein
MSGLNQVALPLQQQTQRVAGIGVVVNDQDHHVDPRKFAARVPAIRNPEANMEANDVPICPIPLSGEAEGRQ